MEKVKYNIAIKTYMEVFDYLINNDLFVFDAGRDFLKSKIKIDAKYGFIKETQSVRGIWENSKEEVVPAIYVLKVLTDNLEEILRTLNIPAVPNDNYAYINDMKAKLSGKKTYYGSYQEILAKLKDVKAGQEKLFYSDGKVIDFSLVRLRELSSIFEKMTPLDIRTIECYARLEEELINYTANLLLVDEYGYPLDDFHRRTFDGTDSSVKLAGKDMVVDWEEFKECILDNYQYQKDENKFDLHGVYSPWDSNPYKSELGLDGKTK